jgi:hypothetical protein
LSRPPATKTISWRPEPAADDDCQLVDAATDEGFLSPLPEEPEEAEEPDEDPFELDDPDEPAEPESPDELADFEDSELPDELSDDDPLDPLAEPSLAAGTLLAAARLSVR